MLHYDLCAEYTSNVKSTYDALFCGFVNNTNEQPYQQQLTTTTALIKVTRPTEMNEAFKLDCLNHMIKEMGVFTCVFHSKCAIAESFCCCFFFFVLFVCVQTKKP